MMRDGITGVAYLAVDIQACSSEREREMVYEGRKECLRGKGVLKR